jgi:hypothetical protein
MPKVSKESASHVADQSAPPPLTLRRPMRSVAGMLATGHDGAEPMSARSRARPVLDPPRYLAGDRCGAGGRAAEWRSFAEID